MKSDKTFDAHFKLSYTRLAHNTLGKEKSKYSWVDDTLQF